MIDDDDPLVLQPKNTLARIDHLWAFVSVDPHDNNEGVVCATTLRGFYVPLIAADDKRLEGIKPIVKEIAQRTGLTIKLVKFSCREEIETIEP